MEIEMGTDSSMFARKPKRWIKKIRRELVEQAMEEKGITRIQAEAAVATVTDEQIMHATYGCGITADQVSDGSGTWFDWIRDMFSKIDWLKVVQVLLPLIFLFLGKQPTGKSAKDEDDGA